MTSQYLQLLLEKLLKSEIDEVEGIVIHPLDPSDISSDVVDKLIPKALKEFLLYLCKPPNDDNKKVMSIVQDIISLCSRGRKRMPKNVSLGISLKTVSTQKSSLRI